MTTFSEESKLLVDNWEAHQDVLKADRRLRREFQKALTSLEARLQKKPFWSAA